MPSDDSSSNRPAKQPITFGVSEVWTRFPGVVIFPLYYVFLSPQYPEGRSSFWALGTYLRGLAGKETMDKGIALTAVIHLCESVYTVILVRRYEVTLTVGVRAPLLFWKGEASLTSTRYCISLLRLYSGNLDGKNFPREPRRAQSEPKQHNRGLAHPRIDSDVAVV